MNKLTQQSRGLQSYATVCIMNMFFDNSKDSWHRRHPRKKTWNVWISKRKIDFLRGEWTENGIIPYRTCRLFSNWQQISSLSDMGIICKQSWIDWKFYSSDGLEFENVLYRGWKGVACLLVVSYENQINIIKCRKP